MAIYDARACCHCHQHSLQREVDRADNFEGMEKLVSDCAWFKPQWRAVILKWYREVMQPDCDHSSNRNCSLLR